MFFDAEMTISNIVQSDYRTADVFKKYNINFCCSGQISLGEACKLKNLEPDDILSEIKEATINLCVPNTLDISSWNINFLIDFIINIHHSYLKLTLPQLELRLVSFAAGHAKKIPELSEIEEAFLQLQFILHSNMHHEEEVIFPYIKQIYTAQKRNEAYANLFVKTLRKPLDNIDSQHNKINKLLLRIQELSNNYSFTQNACTNHQVLYHKLNELHCDLMQHNRLEKKFLFPKAIEIERELLQL